MRHHVLSTLFAAALLTGPAAADTVFTPYASRAFGGQLSEGHVGVGGSVAFLGKLFGLEFDLGYTPKFFGEASGRTSNVTTLMGNIVLSIPLSDDFTAFGLAGAGLLKSRVESRDDFFDVDENDFGVSLGGGAEYRFDDHFGARGDLRYFRNLTGPSLDNADVDLGDFDYWRASVGLTFRW